MVPTPVEAAPVDEQSQKLQSEETRLLSLREALPSTVNEAMGVTSLQEQLNDATSHLETMKSVSREIHVNAPVYGVVGQVRYRQGDDLPNGEIMVRILHTDRRYIMVHLPTRRVTEMQAGHEVELMFPGNQEFRGQIVDVPMLADTTGSSGDTLAAVRIEPVGRLWPMIPVGSQVDVVSLR
jgi:multidrug resistance efflux pump